MNEKIESFFHLDFFHKYFQTQWLDDRAIINKLFFLGERLSAVETAILKSTICIWVSASRTQTSFLSVSKIHCINWSILNFNVNFKII